MNIEEMRSLPIGFLDSGVGGISVLKQAVKLMPTEDYIYFGDSANAPYGVKEPEEIRRLTFAVVDHLLERGIKGLAVACNTATSAAVRKLRLMYPELPIVGIEPAIKPAVEMYHGGNILVMATPMTIAQEKFHVLLDKYRAQAEIVPVACKGLMELVEAGDLEGRHIDEYFREYIAPYVNSQTETIVLGCTHYPFLRPHLRSFLKNDTIHLIDGSFGTARELKRRLDEKGLLKNGKERGTITFENSLESQRMIDLSKRLLEMPID